MRVALLLVLTATAHAEPDDLPVPPPEHGQPGAQLPAVPEFPAYPTYSDGSHTVKELRLHGAKLRDTELTVRGVVTWAYDCTVAVRMPGESERAVKKRIEDDPTLCERPKFYLGDTADARPEKSVWVVDVPRVYNKLEKERIPKQDRNLPDRCETAAQCPPYKVGDRVVVTGAFKVSSPHSERNSDGLIVYGKLSNQTQKWGPPVADASLPAPIVESPSQPSPPVPPPAVAATRAHVDPKVKSASLVLLNQANHENGAKQFATAADDYRKALDAWPGNHLAWFGLGGALAGQADWKGASDAFAHAVELRGDVAMYQMWAGVAAYEQTVAAAREDQARRENVAVDVVRIDASTLNFERARQHLEAALARDPALWRAHYYVGRIARDGGHARHAADAFSRAIVHNAREVAPYIALAELYRKWDYTDQAIAVATAATQQASDVAYAWFLLGMADDDKGDAHRAIDAFTKALDVRRDHPAAKFQRGQDYFRLKDYANAKRDLTEFVKSAGASLEFEKQQAAKMLMDIAAAASR